jgi:hypothetical protein
MKVCAVEQFDGRDGGHRPTFGPDLSTVIAGHSASEDARERAYDPAIHRLRLKCFFSMDARVKPGHDESRTTAIPKLTNLPDRGHRRSASRLSPGEGLVPIRHALFQSWPMLETPETIGG